MGRLLAEHNQEAVDIQVAYITAYISSNAAALPPANVMPLPGFTYPPHAACPNSQQLHLLQPASGMGSEFAQGVGISGSCEQGSGALQAYRKKHRVSSPFVSLSGTATAAGPSSCHVLTSREQGAKCSVFGVAIISSSGRPCPKYVQVSFPLPASMAMVQFLCFCSVFCQMVAVKSTLCPGNT